MRIVIIVLSMIFLLSSFGCTTNPLTNMERMERDLYKNKDPHDRYKWVGLLIIRCQNEQQERCHAVVMSVTKFRIIQKALDDYYLLHDRILVMNNKSH